MSEAGAARQMLRRITLENLLSFGPDPVSIEMERLNILIGPNASGKSNFIEALALMRSTPISGAASNSDIQGVVRRGGGIDEWIFKGSAPKAASIDVLIQDTVSENPTLRHFLSFRAEGHKFHIEREWVRSGPMPATWSARVRRGISPDLSVLAQLRDPEHHPEISRVTEFYEGARFYREWMFGRNTVFREPQRADMRNDRLEEDFSNLGLFLSKLRKTPKAKAAILAGLRDLYEGVTDFEPVVEGGTVQVFFTEGDFTVPATRLSDGTLRYLALLAILCDPSPPPLICIEEPELGLHPDILPKLADLLLEASERTQLVVTTHSDVLVDAMTDRPETVIVCEKHQGKTELRRLRKAELERWLEKYRLGDLWLKGQLGGTRW